MRIPKKVCSLVEDVKLFFRLPNSLFSVCQAELDR